MRLSELSGKEIIGFDHGERLGTIGHADLQINQKTGDIQSFILPGSSFLGFGKRKEALVIPWKSIIKIGPDMMIVELYSKKQEAVEK
ncbi:YlmC/YmxH family sporulation protein [Brevibacillus ginsengisoli]|uniref:YlmC/YmxH family sporulation protein n=1 Tax=Brevibacillus ginsengisoli TaxID=363854 RepID=UPI003CF4A9B5